MASPVLVERVRRRLVASGATPTHAAVAAALRAEGVVRADVEVLAVLDALHDELTGAGVLAPLLRDPSVTDVLVNGPDDVWVERAGRLERCAIRLDGEAAVRRLAQRLAQVGGRRLDDSTPWVDARLPDGVRLHAVLHPIATAGTCLSLRVPRRTGWDLDELAAAGMVCDVAATTLRRLVCARAAFLVTGGTGSGKTSLLGALLALVPAGERVVVVEEASELRPRHPHVLLLAARPANVEGAGAATVRDLVRQALRMRPDRLVVGEVRGGEVVDLLAALNTGHEGGCGTVHASSPQQLPARVEALATAAGLPRDAAHSQLAAGVDVVVHLSRRDGRRVSSIGVLVRAPSGFTEVRPALVLDATTRRLRPTADIGLLDDVLDRSAA